jgi:hypothetical protein
MKQPTPPLPQRGTEAEILDKVCLDVCRERKPLPNIDAAKGAASNRKTQESC